LLLLYVKHTDSNPSNGRDSLGIANYVFFLPLPVTHVFMFMYCL